MERRDPDTEEHKREGRKERNYRERSPTGRYDTKIHPTRQEEEGKDRREEAKRKDRAKKRRPLLDTAGNYLIQALAPQIIPVPKLGWAHQQGPEKTVRLRD